MIIVRNTFRLKFGQAKPAVAAFKEGRQVMAKVGLSGKTRVLTDITGPSYTLVFETEHDNLTGFEQESKQIMNVPEWRAWYEKFMPYVESGSREIYTVVE